MKYITVFAVLALVLASGCVTNEEVRIGTLLPLTGDLAAYGGPMEDGARLAINEVNENGGVLGGNIALVTTDSQTTGVAAVGAMNQLVTVDKVSAVIGAAGSGVSLAVIDIAVNNHIVQISPSNTAPDFTTYPDDGFYYRTVPSDALQGKAMAKLANERGYLNVSTFVLNNPYGVGFEEVFKEEFEKLGGTVIDRVKYDPSGVTFDSEVDKVSANNPDVIIKVGKTVEGKYIVANFTGTTPDPRATGPAYDVFAAAYGAEFGREPATFSSNTYDAAAIIALAIEKAGSADGTAIRDAIPDVANAPGEEVSDIGTPSIASAMSLENTARGR
jgi:branched-chain amino acid transport system substrate-binding protein/neutral amino acid transport system substrate-binding protein